MSLLGVNNHQEFVKSLLAEEWSGVLLEGAGKEIEKTLVERASTQGKVCLVYDFEKEDLLYPYAPWLSLILVELEKLSEPQRQKIYKEEKIYFFLEQLLESHLRDGMPSRREPLIEEEVQYERTELFQGMKRLFVRFFPQDSKQIIILTNLHFASYSTIDFLRFLGENDISLPIYALYKRENGGEALEEIVSVYREKHRFFELSLSENQDLGISPWKKVSQDKEKVTRLQRMFFQYHALRDVVRLGQLFLDQNEILEQNDEAYVQINWQVGKALAILGDYNEAAVYLNRAFILMNGLSFSLENWALFYRDMAYLFFMKDAIPEALEMVEKGFHLPDVEENTKAYFELFFLYFQIEDKNRKQQPRPWKEIYDKIIEITSKLGYENHLALIYINPYGIYSEYASDVDKYNTLALNEKGIAIAKRLRNTYRLSHGYQLRGLIYAVMGNYDEVIQWYRKSLVLKKRMGFPREIAYGYNGVGFYYYMTGRYVQAYEYYREALKYLFSLKDFHEIAMTYFNLGANCLLALDEKCAIVFFEEVLALVEILGMNGLAYHSLFGIYAILGTAYALHGDWLKAYDCINRIRAKKLLPYLEKNEEYFFIAMLLGLLAFHEGRYEDTFQRFREANYYLHRTNDNIGYMIPWYCFVTAKFYHEMGDENLGTKMWHEGMRQSEIQESPFYRMIFLNRRQKTYEPAFTIEEMPAFDHIRELARTEYKIASIYRQMQDIHVLNILQQDFICITDWYGLINATLEKLVSNFLIDFACFFSYESGKWKMVAHQGKDLSCEDAESLVVKLSASFSEVLFRSDEKTDREWIFATGISSLAYLPLVWDEHKVCLLCGTMQGQTLLTRDDMRVLRLIVQQMRSSLQRLVYLEQIEKQKQELAEAYKKLQEMVVHDVLTGVMNRLALSQRLGEEIARVKRYKNRVERGFVLGFLDMDNFKGINDTYGHTIGDKVLALTAQELVRFLRKVDLVFRYGGDEFVLLFPETTGEAAQIVAERILKELPQRVKNALNKDLLPTFSLGMVVYTGEEDFQLEDLLQRVDRALYEAKSRGKNCFVLK
ncbi:tetratricopeptide repeat-containing diguanylate cyclase [Thermospira aquatica]|uniref:diguanylate cyclase n=1 Tax=Thermospira aquatica TaxID=2828656 RepID=A0AAX3BE99_9SPIR|nr:tetratricopeptide repeat-containing diguanylate cyclase [Thermospira aquatica]URA10066.1 GGDEF domain-containing protein [Thermospira aquatica]